MNHSFDVMTDRMCLLYLFVPLAVAAVTLSAMHSSFTTFPIGVPMQRNIPTQDVGRLQGRVFPLFEVAIVRDRRDTRLTSVAGSKSDHLHAAAFTEPQAAFLCTTPYEGEMTLVSGVDLIMIARCTSVVSHTFLCVPVPSRSQFPSYRPLG